LVDLLLRVEDSDYHAVRRPRHKLVPVLETRKHKDEENLLGSTALSGFNSRRPKGTTGGIKDVSDAQT
jgi:hypothetical protein